MADILPSPIQSPLKRSFTNVDEVIEKKQRKSNDGKHVKFGDVEIIYYHNELPPLTRFGGFHVPVCSTHDEEELKCRDMDTNKPLKQVYAQELRDMIYHLGWGIESFCPCDNIQSLQEQFRLIQFIQTKALMEFGQFKQNKRNESPWLVRKDMIGIQGMGYTFGHRFITMEQFIATMDDMKLVHILKAHGIPMPRFVIPKPTEPIPDSMLIGIHYLNGGRSLDQLNVTELKLECSLRNIKEVDRMKKLKKNILLDLLKPLLEQEYLARCAEQEQREQMEFLATNLLLNTAKDKMIRCVWVVLQQELDKSPDDELLQNESFVPTSEELSSLFRLLVQAKIPQAVCSCPLSSEQPQSNKNDKLVESTNPLEGTDVLEFTMDLKAPEHEISSQNPNPQSTKSELNTIEIACTTTTMDPIQVIDAASYSIDKPEQMSPNPIEEMP